MPVSSSPKRKTNKRIKDLPMALRPREKLFSLGANNLSDAELLAILLGTGRQGQNVVALSEAVLRQYPLDKLSSTPLTDLVRVSGLGKTKIARISAALELGERTFAPEAVAKVFLKSTSDVLHAIRDIAEKRQEYLIVLYLNARYELVRKEIVGVGSLNHMRITSKEIFAPALQTPCASIIVAHNHPSGDPTPSDDDISFTKVIQQAGEVMGVPLLDHVVIAKTGYFSFRDNKEGK